MARKRNILKYAIGGEENVVPVLWQGRMIYFGVFPMERLQNMDINPIGRIDTDSTKLKRLAVDLFGKGKNKKNLPTSPLYVFPIIDKEGNVIDGHGRIAVHKKAGIDTIPCIVHEEVDKTDAFFKINDKATNKGLSYNDLISSLSRGLPLEKLPKKYKRDYHNVCELLGKDFVDENLIVEAKGVPSFYTVHKMLSTLSNEHWFNSRKKELMFQCYHWLFVLKNQEAMRAIGGFKSSFQPTERERELVLSSILNGEKLDKSEIDGSWISLKSDHEKVKRLVRMNNFKNKNHGATYASR